MNPRPPARRLPPWLRAPLVACLLLLPFTCSVVALDPLTARWLSAQTNAQSWQANVQQTRSLKSLAQPLQSEGRVWFSAPNLFRWELGTPAQTIAVRQTNQMLVIYPRLKRAERYPLDGRQGGPWRDTLALLEAGFPRSEKELTDRFVVVGETNRGPAHELALQPRAAAARRLMPRLTVTFSTNDFSLLATELEFADGSRLRNAFTQPVSNPPIPSDLFHPVLGPEVRLVEPGARTTEVR